ncbi:MAG: PilT protein domain protein [Candidatus Aminicenantes bacterium]|nr:PilT protein domain protein [Candidatus Aminicenantes bacterium]
MRVVFDTNVLVAAFAADGLCAKLLRRANRREFSLVLCPVILEEFERVLKRKLGATAGEIRNAIALLAEISTVAGKDPTPAPAARLVRDPDDDLILACATAARAEILVTGDKDLLDVGRHRHTRIVDPRAFELLFS